MGTRSQRIVIVGIIVVALMVTALLLVDRSRPRGVIPTPAPTTAAQATTAAPTSIAGIPPTIAIVTVGPAPRLTPTPAPGSAAWSPGTRTKTSGCAADGPLPDAACTPGAVLTMDVSAICQSGYASSVRHVSGSVKAQVYTEYGVTEHTSGEYEVDHLISLELGGSNDIANLWPEPAEPTPGYHQKDAVENYLHGEVCAGRMPLAEAQRLIATDWLAVYEKIQKS